MNKPTLRFRPLRPAVASDRASTLDLLLTITPPPPPTGAAGLPRPPLNLALVIDRSGSMRGTKLSYARKAARFLAGELTTSSGVQASQLQRAFRSLDQHNQAVATATSAEELQQAVREIGGVSLDGLNAAVPLQQLKARLRRTVTIARGRIEQRAEATKPSFFTAVVQPVALGMLLALAYAIGFAAATTTRRGDCSLLEQILLPWIVTRQRYLPGYMNSKRTGPVPASNQQYDPAPGGAKNRSGPSIPPPGMLDSEYFHHLSSNDETDPP